MDAWSAGWAKGMLARTATRCAPYAGLEETWQLALLHVVCRRNFSEQRITAAHALCYVHAATGASTRVNKGLTSPYSMASKVSSA